MRSRWDVRGPDFFIVGAPKCGTTAMNDYLASHPNIFMAVKELHYFSEWNALSEDEYLAFFRGADRFARAGEASVHYLTSASACSGIASWNPKSQIVIMLRHPVEVVAAMHAEEVWQGVETIPDLSRALAAEAARRSSLPLAVGVSLAYRATVEYEPNVRRYLQTFGRDKVHVVLYDDFEADPLASYQALLRFLAVDDRHKPHLRVINPRKRARSVALHRFVLHHPEVLRRLSHSLVPDPLRRRLWRTVMTLNSRPTARAPIDQVVAERLCAELAPGILRLGELLDRDLSAWLVPPRDAGGSAARPDEVPS